MKITRKSCPTSPRTERVIYIKCNSFFIKWIKHIFAAGYRYHELAVSARNVIADGTSTVNKNRQLDFFYVYTNPHSPELILAPHLSRTT